MAAKARPNATWIFLAVCSIVCGLLASPDACAQDPAAPACSASICPGDKAVYNQQLSVTNSHAYIDITPLSGADICAKITSALLSLTTNTSIYTSMKGVIDARGYKPGTTQNCGTSPWNSTNNTTNTPAVVLLPSGNHHDFIDLDSSERDKNHRRGNRWIRPRNYASGDVGFGKRMDGSDGSK